MFTKCEVVFRPLMKRLREAFENDGLRDVDAVMECIDSMMEHVELLTPSFIRVYQIGALLKQVKKAFESTHPEVRARCKRLSAEMKRVFNEKEKMVPEEFEPVKDLLNWMRWIISRYVCLVQETNQEDCCLCG